MWYLTSKKFKEKTLHSQTTASHWFDSKKASLFLASNALQESINKTDILTVFSTDHSHIFYSLSKNIDISREKGLWKFNNSFSKLF